MGPRVGSRLLLLVAWLTIATSMVGQGSIGAKPKFEAASVKPNLSGDQRVAILGQPGGRFTATNTSLAMLMGSAYRIREFQIVGGPGWIRDDRWDIQAKAEEGAISPSPSASINPAAFTPQQLMLQSLIEERFQLKMHREMRELPVYDLVALKGASKLKMSEDQGPIQPQGTTPQRAGSMPRGGARLGRGAFDGNSILIGNLAAALSQELGRPVIDKTDLKGRYDVMLRWAPEPLPSPVGPVQRDPATPADAAGPSIFTSVQEQLGLKLESSKGTVEVLLIDSVQRPSEN
jgi:uncharacterized protein (TIGR03435 family)